MDVKPTPPLRAGVLSDALELTTGDRNQTYGDPYENMQRTADLFNAFLGSKLRKNLNARDVASLLALLKLARIGGEKDVPHRDNYVDGAAYLAIAYECAQRPYAATDDHQYASPNSGRKSKPNLEFETYSYPPIVHPPISGQELPAG